MSKIPFIVHFLYWILPLLSVLNAIIMVKIIPEEDDI